MSLVAWRVLFGLIGAVVGGVLAILVAGALASGRTAGSPIGPIEEALIALSISAIKDLTTAGFDAAKDYKDAKLFLTLIKSVRADLQSPRSATSAIPVSTIRELASADGVRRRAKKSNVAKALERFDQKLDSVGYAQTYHDLLPADVSALESEIDAAGLALKGNV